MNDQQLNRQRTESRLHAVGQGLGLFDPMYYDVLLHLRGMLSCLNGAGNLDAITMTQLFNSTNVSLALCW